ncbi:MAG: CPBP family intramembrane metalloprotease [Clostridia bacterium]|nr:CPBP family intramembrane metalloprotease [Clostridia bacterium]
MERRKRNSSACLYQGWRLYALLLLMAVIPAIAEEMMFRGALLHAWKPSGAKRALWHTALLFSLIHLEPNNLPALLFLGLLFGSVSLETGSVYPAMVVHGVNNLIAVLISSLAGAEAAASDFPSAAELLPALALYIVFGLMLGVPSYYALRFFAKRRREQQAALQQAAGLQQPAPVPAPDQVVPERRGPFVALTYVIMVLLNAAIVAALFIQIPGL